MECRDELMNISHLRHSVWGTRIAHLKLNIIRRDRRRKFSRYFVEQICSVKRMHDFIKMFVRHLQTAYNVFLNSNDL